MTTRADLAAAADEVEGFTGHPYYTADTDPGTVFIRLDRTEYPNRLGGINHWNVIVLLPQDPAESEKYVEDNIGALKAALDPHMVVTQVAKRRLQLDGVGTLPCAFIIGHRKA